MSESHPRNPFEDAPVIFSYTRAQAIEDGVLVDLTEWAAETGFRYPVACTSSIWNGYVVPPEQLRPLGLSERGRGHDLLWMLWNAIRRRPGGDRVAFEVLFLQSPRRHVTVYFQAVCGPGDQGEPVITIMLPGED
ncbi:hypothetical protein LCGC14_1744750 [marine sediment metagenome]|uniref:Uncharacterized protein n=1 Tax=marine sediment metagenome TaxID=412755 RepID=A0A0F9JKX5_9ZZZZ